MKCHGQRAHTHTGTTRNCCLWLKNHELDSQRRWPQANPCVHLLENCTNENLKRTVGGVGNSRLLYLCPHWNGSSLWNQEKMNFRREKAFPQCEEPTTTRSRKGTMASFPEQHCLFEGVLLFSYQTWGETCFKAENKPLPLIDLPEVHLPSRLPPKSSWGIRVTRKMPERFKSVY